MNSSNSSQVAAAIRTYEVNVSADNLLNMLFVTGLLSEKDEILSVSFKNSVKGFDLKNNPTVVIPLTFKIQDRVS